jgi:hypothetical protein
MYASISTPHLLLINQQVPLWSIGFLPSTLASRHDMKCTNTFFCDFLPFLSWLCYFTTTTCSPEENMCVPSPSLKHGDFVRCNRSVIFPLHSAVCTLWSVGKDREWMTIFPTAHIAKVLSQWEAREMEARARVPCTRTVMISQLLRSDTIS